MEQKQRRLLELALLLDGKLDDIEAALQGTHSMARAVEARAEEPSRSIKDNLDMLSESLHKSIDRCTFLREQIEDIGGRI